MVDSPLLNSLSDDERRALRSLARRRKFKRNEVVFHRGDPADTLHVIERGRFAVRVTTPLGDVATLAVLAPGGIFGEVALLAHDAVRTATVAALEPAETLSIYKDDLTRLRREHPETTEAMVAALVAEVRRLTERLVEALYVPVEFRVLHRLRELGDQYASPDQPSVTVPLTQEELASLAGTSRATVNKVLGEEVNRGHVRLTRGRVEIVDRAALAERAKRLSLN